MKKISLKLIDLYRLVLSPYVGNACRFTPTCSQYTRQAIIKHGFLKGVYLGFWRIISCNPYGRCGCDPVPRKFSFKPYACDDNSAKTSRSVKNNSQQFQKNIHE